MVRKASHFRGFSLIPKRTVARHPRAHGLSRMTFHSVVERPSVRDDESCRGEGLGRVARPGGSNEHPAPSTCLAFAPSSLGSIEPNSGLKGRATGEIAAISQASSRMDPMPLAFRSKGSWPTWPHRSSTKASEARDRDDLRLHCIRTPTLGRGPPISQPNGVAT